MILDKEHIERVESFIEKHKVDFIDVKHELLDHIACDVETIMQKENLAFEDAFQRVKVKWKPLLEERCNFWMGLLYVKPRLVIDKCGGIMKKVLLNAIAFGLAFSVVAKFSLPHLPVNLGDIRGKMNIVLWLIFTISALASIYHTREILQDKNKTVYGYCYVRQFSALPVFFLLLCLNPNTSGIDGFENTFLVMALCFQYFSFKIYNQHKTYSRCYIS